MKKAKRALALALVFALVASFCVTGAAAAPGDEPTPGDDSSYVQNGEPVEKDGVTVSKTAEYVGKNEYKITLSVTIPGNVTVPGSSANVVLVIDRSGSMGDGGKMSAAKEAAKAFADALLKDGNDVKMAVVSYADNVSTNQALTNSAEDVKDAVDGIRANGGTHIQAGIHRAREILEDSSADKQVIVVLSDGEPTYSFRSIGTGTYSHEIESGLFGSHVEHELVEKSVKVTGFDYNDSVGSGSSYSLITDLGILGEYNAGESSITVTCEECDHVGTETVSYYENNGDPTIAEADFARDDGYEVYGLYLGTPNENAQDTMQGVADSGKYQQADTDSLNGLLQDIAGDVTETTAGAVTDPMGNNITLGDVSDLADDGVTATGNGLTWNPTNGKMNQDGSTTYTVTYPITVDGEELTASDWLEANDTTTFTYEVNGEERTAEFNVPKVWGEKPVMPPQGTPQDVYVYVEVVKDDGNEFSEDEIAKLGLAAINEHGYYTIGVVNNVTMPDIATADTSNIYDEYGNGVTTKINNGEITRYAPNAGCDLSKVKWYSLHKVTNGADDYPVTGNCWHLDGRIRISDIEKVTVTYTSGYGDNTTLATYDTIKGSYTPTISSEPTRNGYTFTGWKKVVDGEPSGDILSSEDIAGTPLTEDTTYVAQWSLNTNEVYIKVYLDDEDVTAQYNTYLSGLTTTGTTSGIGEIEYESGHVVVPYAYEDIDAADVKFSVNSGYVLQGVSGMFVYGESGWGGVDDEGGPWTVDNVDGGTTLNIYLNTAYKVEYSVPSGTAPTDDNTYIVGESVSATSNPDFGNTHDNSPLEERNVGVKGSWKNPDDKIKTEITIATLPTGTNGWYREDENQHTGDTLAVSVAAAASSGYDNNGDHIFTFTATAKEYTVTYHANNGASSEVTYDGGNVSYGGSHTVLGNDTTNFNNTGYTFAGWATSEDGEVIYEAGEEIANITENVNLYAKWTAITGKLTVTKTVEGLEGNDTLPDAFAITVSGTSGAADGVSYTLTIGMSNGENIKYSYDEASGTHQWVISGAALGTYTVTEANYKVDDYLWDGTENEDDTATATITDANGAEVTLTNSYTAISRELSVVKTVIKVGDAEVAEGATTIPAAKVGDTIIYKIVVTNNSNVALTNISVTDTLGESELTLHTDAACTETASTTISSLAAYGQEGDSETFYAKYEVTADDAEAGSVKNTATAKAGEGGPEDSGEVTVNVTPQYKVDVVYHYDTVDGTTFAPPSGTQTVFTYNAGEDWNIGTVPEKVSNNGENYIFDESRSDDTSGTNISSSFTVDLVYVKDEWKDGDPDGEDDDEGGDGTPDYKQARILYEVAEGQDDMGGVSPTIDVVTLTDDDSDGVYSGEVKAESTAMPEDGNVFVSWSGNGYSPEVQTNELSHEFTAVGGETYTYTASFKTGTTDAEVTKTLVSYTRGDAEPAKIPEGFKARVGDVLNYEISVKNTGEVALNTAVTDSITGEGTLTINNGEGYTVEDGKIIISGLAPEGSVTITASYTVVAADAGKTITNTATADLPGDEPGDDPTGEEEVTVDEYGITVTPADITIYMGGDEGYVAVVDENGQVINDNNSLPTPLFTVELSESFGELSVEQIEAIVIAGTTSDEGTRGWRFDYAGETEDGEDLYYIVPDEGQDPIRVTYTNTAGEEVVSDHFDPAAINELFAEFAIKLYTDTVTSVTAEVNGITCKIDYSGTGTLTVRAVDDTDENPVVGVQETLPRPVEAGEGAVTAPAGTTYTLNETTVQAEAEGVGLLFDGIIDDEAGRTGALLAELESELGVTVEDGNYQAQYLDLVDAHNGNAWVKASGAVTVYWGYPEGTGEGTDFALYHFEGLHREGENSGFDIEDVATSDIERVTITKTANGIAFDISSGGFSPFVLVWDDGDGGDEPWWPPIGPGDDDDDGDDGGDGEFVPKWLNIDDHYAYIIGYEDGTVRPQGNITRAEVATIFFRLLTDEVREEYWSTVSGYTDVKAGDWYNNAISTLSDLGIITGYEDGTFRPNASITRAEFVTIATRFFDYAAEYEGAFSDVSYSSWYADFVQAAVDMGLVNGYENGTFRPNASITRAEAVAIVNRVLLRRPDADHLLPWSVMNTFSDNVLESAWYYEDIQEATNSHDYEWLKSGVEDWTEKLPERDWAALEREWSSAYDAPGGEVTG